MISVNHIHRNKKVFVHVNLIVLPMKGAMSLLKCVYLNGLKILFRLKSKRE